MRNIIIGTIITVVLLGGGIGTAYHQYAAQHKPYVQPKLPPAAIIETPSQPAATPTSQPVTTQPTTPTYVAPSYTVPAMDFSTPLPSSYVAPPKFDTTYTPTPAYHVTTPTQTWQTKPTDNCIGASAVGC